jgi:hypothetical protein
MFKITERKNDGWSYEEELAFPKDIYEFEAILFNKALMSLFSDSQLTRRFEAGNYEEKKDVIWTALMTELDSVKDNLRHDLNHFVKIFPLIKKEVQK